MLVKPRFYRVIFSLALDNGLENNLIFVYLPLNNVNVVNVNVYHVVKLTVKPQENGKILFEM